MWQQVGGKCGSAIDVCGMGVGGMVGGGMGGALGGGSVVCCGGLRLQLQ
jgi:hypothetical protein